MLQRPRKMLHKNKKDNLYPLQSVTKRDLPECFPLSDEQKIEPKEHCPCIIVS